MYGYDLIKDSKPKSMIESKPRPTLSSTSFMTTGRTNKCICCNSGCSKLELCNKFKSVELRERRMLNRRFGLCDNCLQPNHIARQCPEPSACTVPECHYKHHALLHTWVSTRTDTPQSNIYCASTTCAERKVAMAIVPIRVMGAQGRYVDTYPLLDNGSDVTLCDERLLPKLGIIGKEKSFSITTVNHERSTRVGTEVYLNVKSIRGGKSMPLKKVWTVSKLPVSLKGLPNRQTLDQWPHLEDLYIPRIRDGEATVLIGSDEPDILCPIDVRRGKPGEPCAIKSFLVWTVIGPLCSGNKQYFNVNFQQSSDDILSDQVKRFWETEFSDLKQYALPMSVEDQCALNKMEASTVLEEGHFRIALPWRENYSKLPNNWSLAHSRLTTLKRKLQRDEDMSIKYQATMNDYINKGYARKRDSKEVSKKSEKIWYLPHHPVLNENKPGKIRVVFDCAAKFTGTSLNDQLFSGPDLVNSLVGVLMRFREERIAIAADIEAMFHQVKVDPIDHDALRFLWWQDGDCNKKVEEYCMQVHLFGATSSPSCSAYALKRTALDQCNEFDKLAVDTVNRSFYVDDCLKSTTHEITAIKLANDLRKMLSNRGFRLTKWLSNSRTVLYSVPESERSPNVSSFEFDDLPCERALGIRWNVEADCIEFKVKIKEKPETRRGILSVVSSRFDPLGLVTPVTLKAKLILQNLCRIKASWDKEIPAKERKEWRQWLQELPYLNAIKISRCLKPLKFKIPTKTEVHLFSDAS